MSSTREKIKQTNIEKLGVENQSQSDKIKHKFMILKKLPVKLM